MITKIDSVDIWVGIMEDCLRRPVSDSDKILVLEQSVGKLRKALDMAEDKMLRHFQYDHLPQHLQNTSMQFHTLAHSIANTIEAGDERTEALRKLLEAKDCAVRATLFPGD